MACGICLLISHLSVDDVIHIHRQIFCQYRLKTNPELNKPHYPKDDALYKLSKSIMSKLAHNIY